MALSAFSILPPLLHSPLTLRVLAVPVRERPRPGRQRPSRQPV